MVTEKKQFDAEVGKILSLMIHSLYTDKEIFLRELISNASDACDKLRYLSQTDASLTKEDSEFRISVTMDKEGKTITIRDNGIGMNKEDLALHLGTIAKSGTQSFIEQLSGDAKKDSALIGQFGVGFYSAFMVSDKVTVTSKRAGEDKAYSWISDGESGYELADFTGEFTRGTEVRLHLKAEAEEFLDRFRLEHIIKSYSDHVSVPIFFIDEEGKEEKLNSQSALWRRSKSEITEDEYKEFYKNIAMAHDAPWLTMHNKNEGTVEFTNLLFIPETKTFDLFHPDRKCRVKLYIKRVFIADESVELVPRYLRFLRGVIDSEDLPLNISRQNLQANSTLTKIQNLITKKVLGELKKKKQLDFENYLTFWNNFGGALKEGLCEVTSDHEKILEICAFQSAIENKMISLDDYIANLKGDDKTIYYLSGDESAEKLRSKPQIEGFLSQGIDVLLFTDTVDDFWVNVNQKYKDYEFKSVTRSDIDINKDDAKDDVKTDETADKENTELTAYFKEVLADAVAEVKVSKRLSSSPVCLVVRDGAMDIRMERFLIDQKQLAGAAAKILEINTEHSLVQKIAADVKAGNKTGQNEQLVKLLYDQACIMEGQRVEDVGAYAKRMNELFQQLL